MIDLPAFLNRMQGSNGGLPLSRLCTEKTLMLPQFQRWALELKEAPGHFHRKVWEWCFIAQTLDEAGMLAHGKRGLGFAVGQEPLSAMFANRGAKIVATDLYTEDAQASGWIATGQHAEGYDAINKRGICNDEKLRRLVEFRFADMNAIDPGFNEGFDFVWSSCALEHLGSLSNGAQFIHNAMHCLKPGGIAVHTTEYNISSNDETVDTGATVLYRKRDIKALMRDLRKSRNMLRMDWDEGSGFADGFVDLPPYKHETHLKLKIGQYVVTSIGLAIVKKH